MSNPLDLDALQKLCDAAREAQARLSALDPEEDSACEAMIQLAVERNAADAARDRAAEGALPLLIAEVRRLREGIGIAFQLPTLLDHARRHLQLLLNE